MSILESALVAGVVSVLLSAVVTFFLGERWVEKKRRMHEHALRLNDSSIKYWIKNIDELCPLGAHYDNEWDLKVVGNEVKKFESLPYSEFIESHIRTGYPSLLEQWSDYRNEVDLYNKEKASILDGIKNYFENYGNKLGIEIYYHRKGKLEPKKYLKPYEIAVAIFEEMDSRINDYEPWYSGKPEIRSISKAGSYLFELTFREKSLIIDATKDIINEVKKEIESNLNSSELFTKVASNNSQKNLIQRKKEELLIKLNMIVEYIELGHNMKGNCDACKFHLGAR